MLGRVTLRRGVDNVGPQINPISFDSGIFVSRTLKRQCHHNGAGVAGLSGAGRDDGFRLLLGAIAFV